MRKRFLAVAAVTALFSGSVLGQAPAPRPAFDVAGIQNSTRPQPCSVRMPFFLSSSRVPTM